MNKKNYSKLIIFILALVIFSQQAISAKTITPLNKFLNSLPVKNVILLKAEEPFKEEYEVVLNQLLDHKNISGATFPQRIFVSFVDSAAPVVLITEGYSCGKNHLRELSEILGANQIRVEYRFYGESGPDSIPWKYLNYFQSSNDYHYIRTIFSKYFRGRWISTGWSKGGQTALIYRRFFPEDVAATVAYDAPLNLSFTEGRIDKFFEKVGTPEYRKKIINFQRLVLRNRDGILPLFKKYCKNKGYTFGKITPVKALDYAALEYPFSFWQYHHIPCSEIPDSTNSPEQIFEHLKKVVYLGSYTDRAFDSISMYQFSTELGYYGYVTKNVADLLSQNGKNFSNTAFAPSFVKHEFDPLFMRDIVNWLLNYGNKIIYIYGENDPWSAPSIEISDSIDAVKVYVTNGNHFSFIRTFPNRERSDIIEKIRKWIDSVN